MGSLLQRKKKDKENKTVATTAISHSAATSPRWHSSFCGETHDLEHAQVAAGLKSSAELTASSEIPEVQDSPDKQGKPTSPEAVEEELLEYMDEMMSKMDTEIKRKGTGNPQNKQDLTLPQELLLKLLLQTFNLPAQPSCRKQPLQLIKHNPLTTQPMKLLTQAKKRLPLLESHLVLSSLELKRARLRKMIAGNRKILRSLKCKIQLR